MTDMSEIKTYTFTWSAALYDKLGGWPLGIFLFVALNVVLALLIFAGLRVSIIGGLFWVALSLTALVAAIVRADTTDRFDPTFLELTEEGLLCFPRENEPYLIPYESITRLHKPPPKFSREGATLKAEGLPMAELHISEHFKDYDALIDEIARRVPHAELKISDLKQTDRSF